MTENERKHELPSANNHNSSLREALVDSSLVACTAMKSHPMYRQNNHLHRWHSMSYTHCHHARRTARPSRLTLTMVQRRQPLLANVLQIQAASRGTIVDAPAIEEYCLASTAILSEGKRTGQAEQCLEGKRAPDEILRDPNLCLALAKSGRSWQETPENA